MARRASTKRRKRKAVARHHAAAPRRRRRRAAVTVFAANPATRRRRRRRHHLSVARARRRYRRNPPMLSGVSGTLLGAAVDGAAVVVGQVAARKATGAVVGAFPSHVFTPTEKVAVTVASAIGATLLARKLPGKARAYSRMIAAGAFSEAINATLAQSPTASKILSGGSTTATTLSAFAPARVGVRAYPQALPRAGVRAYPTPRSSGLPVQVGN